MLEVDLYICVGKGSDWGLWNKRQKRTPPRVGAWGRWVRSSGANGLVLEIGREVAGPALL